MESNQTSDTSSQRTLDSFLEDSFQQTRLGWTQWKYWCIMLSLGVANSSDASEILCLSYILSDADFHEHFLPGDSGGLLAAAVFLGMLLGGLFVGTLGDWYGRKPILLLGLGCNVIAGVLSAMAPTVAVLVLLRCIAGVGIGATVPPLFTLATELAPPSQRGLCVTICASFWMVGSIFVAVVAMCLLGYMGVTWRVFAAVCAVPSAMGWYLVRWVVPESPRYLALQGQHSQALNAVNSLAQSMSYRGSLMSLEEVTQCFSQTHGPSSAQARQGVCTVLWKSLVAFFVSASKLYTPQLYSTTWPLQMVWFSLSFGSYGLMTWINTIFVQVHLKDVYFNALLFAISNLPGNILTAVWMDSVGRSRLLVGCVLLSAVSLLTFALCVQTSSPGGIVLSACLFQCFTVACWNVIDTLSSELFPTQVRSTGMGVCAASGRIGAMVAQLVNGALVERPTRLLMVASTTLLLGALTPWLLPDADITGRPVMDELVVASKHHLLEESGATATATATATVNYDEYQDGHDDEHDNTRNANHAPLTSYQDVPSPRTASIV
eukprot:Nitzschia sp. Nitz4//scaffold30_size153850//72090//73736//NITZ4_002779-RA/size153850-processed-gene-0.42-mRNA-1//-1//CDS//3329547267//5018//frame0